MGGSGNAITNNVLLDIQRNGISLNHATGPDNVTISGNTIIGTGGSITLSGNVSGTIVRGNTVSRGDRRALLRLVAGSGSNSTQRTVMSPSRTTCSRTTRSESVSSAAQAAPWVPAS